jgi:hypothetical protein
MLHYATTKAIEEQLRETLCRQSVAEDALVVVSVEHAIALLNHLPQASDGWLIPRGITSVGVAMRHLRKLPRYKLQTVDPYRFDHSVW